MMILRSVPASPFGRKVKIAAALLGLTDRIRVEPANTSDPADSVREQNPLGKIPVLIAADGSSLYDSPVILEYLDHLAGGDRIIPAAPAARFAALRLQALCDGVLDACLLQVYEGRFRSPEKQDPGWVAFQAEKVTRALAVLEQDPPRLDPLPHVGQITLACVLGYLDLRFQGRWRAGHPRLVVWHDRFAAQVSAFEATRAAA